LSTESSLLDLGFDRYQRFRAAGDIIARLAGGRKLVILEIGAFDNALAPFLAGHDHRLWEHPLRPGRPLACAEGGVDLTLALDVLEHVLPAEREFFIKEMARAASLAAVVSFPTAAAREAEEFVYELTGSAWLAQHRQLGLPDKGEMEKMFSALGLSFTCQANASLPSWTAMMLLMYGLDPVNRRQVSRFFNRHYYALENRAPAYRYIYVLSRNLSLSRFEL
jgi:hypothetical protein